MSNTQNMNCCPDLIGFYRDKSEQYKSEIFQPPIRSKFLVNQYDFELFYRLVVESLNQFLESTHKNQKIIRTINEAFEIYNELRSKGIVVKVNWSQIALCFKNDQNQVMNQKQALQDFQKIRDKMCKPANWDSIQKSLQVLTDKKEMSKKMMIWTVVNQYNVIGSKKVIRNYINYRLRNQK